MMLIIFYFMNDVQIKNEGVVGMLNKNSRIISK